MKNKLCHDVVRIQRLIFCLFACVFVRTPVLGSRCEEMPEISSDCITNGTICVNNRTVETGWGGKAHEHMYTIIVPDGKKAKVEIVGERCEYRNVDSYGAYVKLEGENAHEYNSVEGKTKTYGPYLKDFGIIIHVAANAGNKLTTKTFANSFADGDPIPAEYPKTTLGTVPETEWSCEFNYTLKVTYEKRSSSTPVVQEPVTPSSPDAPSLGLYTATDGRRGIKVSWKSVAGATSYELERLRQGLFSESILPDKNKTSTSYVDYDFDWAKTYSYRVKAINSSGESEYSSYAEITPDPFAVGQIEKTEVDGVMVEQPTTVERKKIEFKSDLPCALVWQNARTYHTGDKFSEMPVPVLTSEPYKSVYTFKWWAYSDDKTKKIKTGDTARADDNVLWAVWNGQNESSTSKSFTEVSLTKSNNSSVSALMHSFSSQSVLDSDVTVKIPDTATITDFLSPLYNWTTQDGTPVTTTTTISANTKFVATEKNESEYAIAKQVHFNANGGAFSNGAEFQTKFFLDGKYGDFPKSPSWEGHTFNGWYDDANAGDKVEKGDAIVATTLYAHWSKASSYTLTVKGVASDTSDSSVFSSFVSSVSVKDDKLQESVALPSLSTLLAATKTATKVSDVSNLSIQGIFSKDGTCYYDSNGKATAAAKNYPSSSTSIPDLVLKLTSEASSTSGGKSTAATSQSLLVMLMADGKMVKRMMVTYEQSLPYLSSVPKKSGYKFVGYYDGEDGTGTKYWDANGKGVKKWDKKRMTSVYAYFVKNLRLAQMSLSSSNADLEADTGTSSQTAVIIFNACGGLCAESNRVVRVGKPIGADSRLPTPTWKGRKFLGWWTMRDGGATVSDTDVLTDTDDVALFAHWEAEECSIAFDSQGGTCEVSELKMSAGGNYGAMPTPVRAGCTFAGWYTASEGGAVVGAEDEINESTTLYARWTVKVSFDANGGSGVGESTQYEVGKPYGSLPIPVRTGCSFIGWFYNSQSQEFATNLVSIGDITLTAHWLGTAERDGLKWRYVVMEDDRVELVSFWPTSSVEDWPRSLVIPEIVDGLSVTKVSSLSPMDLLIETVVIPHGIREFSSDVFEGWSELNSVVLPEGIDDTEFAQPRFWNCTKLEQVIVPKGVTRIAEKAFSRCWSLRRIDISEDLEQLGNRAFEGCPANLYLKFWGLPPQGLSNACLNASAVIRYPASHAAEWRAALSASGLTCGASFDDGTDATVRVWFDADGGALSVSNLPYTVGETYASLPTPVRPGYVFSGWRTEDGGSIATTSHVQAAAIKLTACWEREDLRPIVSQIAATTNRTDGVIVSWRTDDSGNAISVFRCPSVGYGVSECLTNAMRMSEAYLDDTATPGVRYHYWIESTNEYGRTRSESVLGNVTLVLSVQNSKFVVGTNRTEGSIAVVANGAWTAQVNGDGVHLLNAYGSGSGELAFYVDEDASDLPGSWSIDIVPVEANAQHLTVDVVRENRPPAQLPNLCFASINNMAESPCLSKAGEDVATNEFFEIDSICVNLGFACHGPEVAGQTFVVKHEVVDSHSGTNVVDCKTLWLVPSHGEIVGYDGECLPMLQFLPTGDYIYRCTIDSDEAISESNEGDNAIEIPFRVTSDPGIPVLRQSDGRIWECEWVVTGKSVSVVSSWPTPSGELIIPDALAGLEVVSVGEYAFAGCELTNVVLGASVTNVGAWAFGNIDGLESVVFENPETSFDLRAFEIQDWFAEETGAEWKLKSIVCTNCEDLVAIKTETGDLLDFDPSVFELPTVDMDAADVPVVRLLALDSTSESSALTLPNGLTNFVSAVGGRTNVQIQANGCWIVDTMAYWLSAVKNADSAEVTISFSANDSSEPRIGKIAFYDAMGRKTTLTVVQCGCETPANDNLSDAIVVTGACGTATGSNFGATTEEEEPELCVASSYGMIYDIYAETSTHTVWYFWTAPESGAAEFVLSASSFDPVMRVFGGNSLTPITVKSLDGEHKCSRKFAAQKNETYLIGIGAEEPKWNLSIELFDAGITGGDFTLSWTLDPEGLTPVRYSVGTSDGFPTITGAIAAATAQYDGLRSVEIIVEDGVYEPIAISSSLGNITIRSKNGAEHTVIDGRGNDTCFKCYEDTLFSGVLNYEAAQSATLIGFTLCNGSADSWGGASGPSGGGAFGGRVVNCIITNNVGWFGGGAAFATLENCIVAKNNAQQNGAGTYACDLIGCTVVGNRASFNGCGGVVGGSCRSCIVWENYSVDPFSLHALIEGELVEKYDAIVSNFNGKVEFSSCCTLPLPDIGENICADPLLSDDGRCVLSIDSPCVDAGDGFAVSRDEDVYLNERIANGQVDIGAVEVNHIEVEFDPSDGVGVNEKRTFAVGVTTRLPSVNFTKKGFVLIGWSRTVDGEIAYGVNADVEIFEDTKLYAVWKRVNLSVTPQSFTFGSDGGSGEISVVADTPWTARPSADWISVDEEIHSGSTSLVFTAYNPFPETRTDYISICSGDVECRVAITQSAYCGTPQFMIQDGVLYGWRGVWGETATISSSVTNIADRALANCPYVRKVYVPATVSQMGDSVFAGSAVEQVIFMGDQPRHGDVFEGSRTNLTVTVPTSELDLISRPSTWTGTTWCGRELSLCKYSSDVRVTLYSNGGSTEKLDDKLSIEKRKNGGYLISYDGGWMIDGGASALEIVWLRTQKAGEQIKLPSRCPTNNLYLFAGWWTEKTGGTRITPGWILDGFEGNLNLYAHWELDPNAKIVSSVVLDDNGGVGGVPTTVVATNGAAMPGIATIPTKTGYAFTGYYDARLSGFGKQYYTAEGESANAWDREDAKVTLYAQWRAHVYDVRFDANAEDVSGEMDDLTGLVYDTQTKLPVCAFVHGDAAMKFIGWALEDDKDTVVCKDGAWISNLTTEDGATVTLYAVWSEKPTEFAFDQSAVSIEKGETFVLTVYGGSDEAATSVRLNVSYGSAKASDLNLKTATVEGANGAEQTNLKFPLTLSWKKGDVEPKTITIPTTAGKATDAPKCLTWNLANATGLALGEQVCCIGTIGAGSSWTTGDVYILPYVADSAGGKVSGGASVNPDKNGNYKAVTLKATANKGYWFAGWYDAEGAWVSGDLSYKVTPDGSNEMPTYEARFVEAQTVYCGTYNGFAKVNLKGMTLVKNADTSADVYGEYAFTATLSTAGKVSGSITVGGKKITIKGDSVFTVDETGVTCYAIADEKSCFGGVNSETIVVYFSSDGVANLWRGDDVDPGVGYDPLCNDDSYGMAYKDVSKDKIESAKFAAFKGTYVGAAVQANDGVVPVSIVIDATGKVKLSGKYSDGTALTASGTLGGYMELEGGTKTAELELVMTPKGIGSGAYHLSVFAYAYEDGTPSLLLNGFATTYTAKEVSSAADPDSQSACLFTTGCWIPVKDVELSDPDFGAIRLDSGTDGSVETIDVLYATKNGVITGLGSSLVSGVTVKFDAKTGFFTVAKGKSYTIQGVLGDYENGCRAAGRINSDGSLLPATVEYVKLTPPEENYPWANEDFSAKEDFVLSLGQSFADDMQPTVTSDGAPLALTISGLPAGLKYDKTMGLITGAPTKSGTSTVKVSYKYGSRTIARVTTLVVAAMPDDMPVGTYAGSATVYIGGDETKPVDYPFTATIGKTGALTGSVTLFGKKATLKASGYDSCCDGTADYTATLDLKSVDRTWGATTVKISLNDEGTIGGESETFGSGHRIAYVQAFRNQTKDKEYADSVAPYVGSYLLSHETSADDKVLAETVMSVTVDKKGTAKIAGTFVDGTAFSASSTLTLFSDGEEAEVMFPVTLKSLGAGGMSVRLVLKADAATGTASFDPVCCDVGAAKYILSDGLYRQFAFANTVMYRYASRAWVDDGLDPDTTCLEVTCESGAFADARFAWTTKTVAGETQITGVGKTINGAKVTFKIDDKTGLFSGTFGTYKIFGAMGDGSCTGVGTVVGKDGSISPVTALGADR